MDDVKDYPPYLDYTNPRKTTTNADRIRAMSDEELADVVAFPHTGNWDLCKENCFECCIEWLKQPAEGE